MLLLRAVAFAGATVAGTAAAAGELDPSNDWDAGLALLGDAPSQANGGPELLLFRGAVAEEARVYLLDRGRTIRDYQPKASIIASP